MENKLKHNFSQSINILIIEDNPVDLRVVQAMLKEERFPESLQRTAQNLSEALNILKEFKADIIILDLNLPDSNGAQTLIKLVEMFPQVAVVINTGAYEEELGLEALGFGAQDFLVKGRYSAYTLIKVMHFAIERKRLESQLKDIQYNLIQSEKMKMVGTLAAGVAHEVRNPLATIKYGVNFLMDEIKERNEKVSFALEGINESVDRANLIISDLLDFAHLAKLNKSWENLEDITNKALHLSEHALKKSKIEVLKRFPVNLPKVHIDKNRVEQVIMNLILNAVYAMVEGGALNIRASDVQLTQSIIEELQISKNIFSITDLVVILEIEDSGVGIPQNKLKEIFDPFFTTRRAKGGVGLGLSVCKSIMEIHHGHIHLANKKDGGVRASLIFKI